MKKELKRTFFLLSIVLPIVVVSIGFILFDERYEFSDFFGLYIFSFILILISIFFYVKSRYEENKT